MKLLLPTLRKRCSAGVPPADCVAVHGPPLPAGRRRYENLSACRETGEPCSGTRISAGKCAPVVSLPYVFLGLAVVLLSGCGHKGRGEGIVVGSKNFTEQIVLAELFAQQIEAHSAVRVQRRLNLGGTFICHDALVAGKIDLYPEYTGTALTAVLKDPPQG